MENKEIIKELEKDIQIQKLNIDHAAIQGALDQDIMLLKSKFVKIRNYLEKLRKDYGDIFKDNCNVLEIIDKVDDFVKEIQKNGK